MSKKKYRFYTAEEKLEYLNLIMEGEYSQAEIARQNNMSSGMLSTWMKAYREGGIEALENKRKPGNPLSKYQNRKKINSYGNVRIWKHEIEDWKWALKKGLYKWGGDSYKEQELIRKEYQIILNLSQDYNIVSLCETMNVSRSGYYKWLKRKDTLNRYELQRENLK